MRRLVASSLIVAGASLASGCGVLEEVTSERAAPELSQLQTFKGKGYRIELPCTPAKDTQRVPVAGGPALSLVTWMCEDADSAFGVATMNLPTALQFNLDGAAQGAADAVGGKVVGNTPLTYAGSPARDVRIESTFRGKPATMFIRVLIRKRVAYQVEGLVVGEHVKKPPALYRKILKSLTFR